MTGLGITDILQQIGVHSRLHFYKLNSNHHPLPLLRERKREGARERERKKEG
jgi:hypothetical protein